jgi:hypothetical protein
MFVGNAKDGDLVLLPGKVMGWTSNGLGSSDHARYSEDYPYAWLEQPWDNDMPLTTVGPYTRVLLARKGSWEHGKWPLVEAALQYASGGGGDVKMKKARTGDLVMVPVLVFPIDPPTKLREVELCLPLRNSDSGRMLLPAEAGEGLCCMGGGVQVLLMSRRQRGSEAVRQLTK